MSWLVTVLFAAVAFSLVVWIFSSAANEWRSAMNRGGLYFSLAAMLVSGALFLGVTYRVVSNRRAGAVGHGSASAPDPEYQKMPADGQADWLTGFTLDGAERQKRSNGKTLKARFGSSVFFFSSCPGQLLAAEFESSRQSSKPTPAKKPRLRQHHVRSRRRFALNGSANTL